MPGFVAFQPMHLHILASVNNDSLAWAVVGVGLLLSVAYVKAAPLFGREVPAWLLGLVVGVGLSLLLALVVPFVVYGVNAITVFVLSGLLAKLFYLLHVPWGDRPTIQGWLYEDVFRLLASPVNASLLYALTWIGAWYLVLRWMYRRDIILKV